MANANIPAELAALPISNMIGAPLEAAMKAQASAAMTTAQFITQVGLDANSNVKNVTFKYKRKALSPTTGLPVDTDGEFSAPFLSIVPIPYIRIKDMAIHFNFTIKTAAVDTTEQKVAVGIDAGANFGFGSVKLTASYNYDNKSTSSVDRSSVLDITVNLVQDEMPEGLRTTLSILKGMIMENPSPPATPPP